MFFWSKKKDWYSLSAIVLVIGLLLDLFFIISSSCFVLLIFDCSIELEIILLPSVKPYFDLVFLKYFSTPRFTFLFWFFNKLSKFFGSSAALKPFTPSLTFLDLEYLEYSFDITGLIWSIISWVVFASSSAFCSK